LNAQTEDSFLQPRVRGVRYQTRLKIYPRRQVSSTEASRLLWSSLHLADITFTVKRNHKKETGWRTEWWRFRL